jgi:tRNA-binding EMAP/Myf-like protein
MIVLVCNVKPCKFRGAPSEAMLLGASTDEKEELLIPPVDAEIGDRVFVNGFDGQPASEVSQKNRIFEFLSADLKTDDNLNATYKGRLLEIKGKGPLKSATLKNAQIK